MKLRTLLFLIFYLVAGTASTAQEPREFDQTEGGGLLAFALVLDDPDWRREWLNPSDGGPKFNAVSSIEFGETAHIALFTSPSTPKHVELTCDVKMYEDGTLAHSSDDVSCFDQTVDNPSLVFATDLDVRLQNDGVEQTKTMRVDISVNEEATKNVLALSLSFLMHPKRSQ